MPPVLLLYEGVYDQDLIQCTMEAAHTVLSMCREVQQAVVSLRKIRCRCPKSAGGESQERSGEGELLLYATVCGLTNC